ncbi:hypothetical protein GSI_15521 [Ganoderma sinense ZZ0214-1]|uniref:non-specific serine/threonine protein kinase n=1 Tax=Ganoderma sinense ZZ0214-1 TaxID=1077348 RepID=A0A2G8RMT8_9APHY|nr:hypothetical protein GSI_15521 [Ganoderma sinense ZZ0214-1]
MRLSYSRNGLIGDGGYGHRSIPNVLAWGRSQYFEYLVMELLGLGLDDLAKGFDALEYVHGRGFVHGDIKPSNFVLGRGDDAGRLYLVDFGFASQWTLDPSSRGHRGTVPYSSLRILKGEALPSLPRDDFESLAYAIAQVMTGPLPWFYWSTRQRLDGGTVSGTDLFPDCACYPDVFAQFVDFACGLAPADDLQHRRWREAFRALDPRLPEHPMFDREDRSGSRRWLRWVPGPPTAGHDDYSMHPDPDGGGRVEHGAEECSADVFGGPDSRSETGGAHGFVDFPSSEWSPSPVALPPCCAIGDEFDVVSERLELVDEPPLYDGGPSVEHGCPPEVMNNTQSDTHCIRL